MNKKSYNKPTISKNFLKSVMLIIVLFIGLLGFLLIHSEYSRFRTESESIREKLLISHKSLIKNEVDKAVSYIEYKKARIEKRLKESIQNRVNEANAIAWNIYEQYHGEKTPEEIQQIVKDALRPLRFNGGRGYYFAFNLKGIEELFADRPEMEGKDMLAVQGAKGEYVVKDMLDIIKRDGQGIYEYTWTKPDKEGYFPKIAFVKLFEPLGWVIGTGEYLDDVENDIQNEVLEFIEQMTYRKDGYVFAGNWKGLSLSGPSKGKNMYDATDVNGIKIVQELIHLAKQGSGYLEYVMPKLENQRPVPKLSYVVGVPKWRWYVGAGIYIDEIETAIQQRKQDVEREIISHTTNIVFILVGLILFVSFVALRIARKTNANLDMFSHFLSKAAVESATIHPDKMEFKELESLAHAANNMISERKQAEESLRESEKRYKSLFKNNCSVMLLIDPENADIIDANAAAVSFYGWSHEELTGKKITDINTLTENQTFQEMELAKREQRQHFYFQHRLANGKIRDVEVYSGPIKIHGKELLYSIVHNITDRKRAQEALKESEEKFRTLAEALKASEEALRDSERKLHAIFDHHYQLTGLIDTEGRLLAANRTALRFAGAEESEVIGRYFWDGPWWDPSQRLGLRNVVERAVRGEFVRFETTHPTADGEIRDIDFSLSPVRNDDGNVVYIVPEGRDITEIKRTEQEKAKLQEQLNQAHKMEAIGTLAGGIAHDFNNILFSMTGYTELALDDAESGTPLHDNLQEVLTAAQRAKDLVKQILTFSRQANQKLKPLKVQLVVREALKLIRSSLPSTIEINQNISNTCGLVMADVTQIHQVSMNLLTNAYHAMEDQGGKLDVSLKEVDLDVDDLKDPALLPGSYVCLTVADTGSGIDKSIMDRIFEPYFSTKGKDKGTGIGLSMVHGIIKSYGGSLKVYSEPGKGSAFHVYLPVIQTQPETTETRAESPVEGGKERILLVDDEDQIVQLEKQILERLGYQVITRTRSIDALETFRAAPDKFDLVITDMTMPEITGVQLSQKLREIRADIPIIMCSGFAEKINHEKTKIVDINGYAVKPVVKSELAKIVRKVLDSDRK